MISLNEFLNGTGSGAKTKIYSIRAIDNADLGGLTLKDYLKTQVKRERIKSFVFGSIFILSIAGASVVFRKTLLKKKLFKEPENT